MSVENEANGVESGESESSVSKQVLELTQKNQALVGLLQDPDIAKVIAAKRMGKPVRVSDEEPEPESDPESEPELDSELEESPDDPVTKVMSKLTKVMDSKLQTALAPLLEQLAGVKSVADTVQRKDITDQISVVKTKYKDFDDYRDSMLKLSKEHEGLSVKDLYVLAKSRSGKLRMVEAVTGSEKPTSALRRQGTVSQTNQTPRPRGRKGFSDILEEALGKLDVTD